MCADIIGVDPNHALAETFCWNWPERGPWITVSASTAYAFSVATMWN